MTASYVVLFRAINVGGNNKLPMKDLAKIFEQQGAQEVQTYIQSGNVVFQSAPAKVEGLVERIGKIIAKSHGFQPDIIFLSAKELQTAIEKNPFFKKAAVPQSMHLFFLAEVPKKPDIEALEKAKAANESFKTIGKVFYLYAPNGVGRSKLAARVQKALGVQATARNWNTVTKLLEMAR